MIRILITLILVATSAAAAAESETGKPPDRVVTPKGGPIRLFDGKTLGNCYTWLKDTHGEDPRRVFRVTDGQLHVTGEGMGSLITKESFHDYHLILEYRWGEKTWPDRERAARDSGLLIHSNGADGGFRGIWMPSLEVQIIEGGVGDFILVNGNDQQGKPVPISLTCNIKHDRNGQTVWQANGPAETFDAKNRHRINWFGRDPEWNDTIGFRGAHDVDNPHGQWNRLDVFADQDRVRVFVNGTQVNEARNVSPHSGRLQLQSELAEIFFRRWETMAAEERSRAKTDREVSFVRSISISPTKRITLFIVTFMYRVALSVIIFVSAVVVHSEPIVSAAEPLRAGTAVVNITPAIGYRMSGYFYERFSTGTHNPLLAKAIVLEQGDQQAAWVFCDMVGVPSKITGMVRISAAKATGISRDHIFIGATHSHTGPLYFGALRDYFHKIAIDKSGADEHEAADYPADLSKKLLSAITSAAEHVTPVELSAGFAEQLGLSFNRRYVLKNGTVATNPGKLNANIVRPAGPIDPQVGLLLFRRDGKPVAGLTVFALHADTTGGTEYSADYPYFLAQHLLHDLGPDYLSMFAPGTCGDINHLDLSVARLQKSHEESRHIGDTLGSTVAVALKKLPVVEQPRLAVLSKTIPVPLQHYTEAEVAAARINLTKVGTRQLPMVEQVSAVKIVGVSDLATDALPMCVQAFRLSDSVALVALPGELFAELGLDIKKRSPFATTIVVELSNDYPGYIPTRRGFAEGSYEPANSKIAPGGGELLAETAVQLLTELHGLKGAKPQSAK